MERKVKALRPVNKKCSLQIEGGINRPPLERTKQVAALFQTAQKIAAELGFPLSEIAVGGGSDGNFTGGLGIPTLDGLGAVGDGAHATHEYVVAAELPRRAALLAGLIRGCLSVHSTTFWASLTGTAAPARHSLTRCWQKPRI